MVCKYFHSTLTWISRKRNTHIYRHRERAKQDSCKSQTHHGHRIWQTASILAQDTGDGDAGKIHWMLGERGQSILRDGGAQGMEAGELRMRHGQHVLGQCGGRDGRDVKVLVTKAGRGVRLPHRKGREKEACDRRSQNRTTVPLQCDKQHPGSGTAQLI